MERREVEVAIVGGGPVGLSAALGLALRGVEVLLLEARAERPAGTRAIGVHPPSLAFLDELGVAEPLVQAGVRVTRGRALGSRGAIGELNLAAPGRYPFVLTVPQPITERLLDAALLAAAPAGRLNDARVESLAQGGRGVVLGAVRGDGSRLQVAAQWVIACDGHRSTVRGLLRLPWVGGDYPDRFAMADLPDDDPSLGSDTALIALHPAGVVEGFPLPGGLRRWVVRLGEGEDPGAELGAESAAASAAEAAVEAVAAAVAAAVRRRSGYAPRPLAASASRFGVARYLAGRFVQGRVLLAGDAAHVISPIGGQGMNLGWLDVADYLGAFDRAGDLDSPRLSALVQRAAARRRRFAQRALLRAERNTQLGRPLPAAALQLRDALLRRLLAPPFEGWARGRFTMAGLA